MNEEFDINTLSEKEIGFLRTAKTQGIPKETAFNFLQQKRSQTSTPKSYFGGAVQDVKQTFGDIGETIKTRASSIKERFGGMKDVDQGEKTLSKGVTRSLGAGIATAGDVLGGTGEAIGEGVIGAAKAITPEFIEKPIGKAISSLFGSIGDTETAQKAFSEWDRFSKENPALADTIEGAFEIATVLAPGSKQAGQAVKGVRRLAGEGVEAIGTGVKKAGQAVGRGVGKTSDIAGDVASSIGSQATGLDPDVFKTVAREAVREGREGTESLFQRVKRGDITPEGELERVKTGIDDTIEALGESGEKYNQIRQSTARIENPLGELEDTLSKRRIDIKDGKLDFTKSNIGDVGDRNALQRAYDLVKDTGEDMDVDLALNVRQQLDDFINYQSATTKKGEGIVKQLREAIDGRLDDKVPGLKELDATYGETKQFLNSILKDVWDSKNNTFKDNAISKIKNVTKPSNKARLERIKEVVPDIEDRINAMSAVDDVARAAGIKTATYTSSILKGGGAGLALGLATGMNPMTAGLMFAVASHPRVVTNTLNTIGKAVGISQKKLSAIADKLKRGTSLDASEFKVLNSPSIANKIAQSLGANDIDDFIAKNTVRAGKAGILEETGQPTEVMDQ